MDDYRRLGVMAALDAVTPSCRTARARHRLLPRRHAAVDRPAAMARAGDERLASVTLLRRRPTSASPASSPCHRPQPDAFPRKHDVEPGYLSADQMAGAFSRVRTNDLIWSRWCTTT